MRTGTFRGFEVAMHDRGICVITFNQPERLNGMTQPMKRDLVETIAQAQMHDDVRVVVVRGAGPAFCAGMDLREMEARGGALGDPDQGVVAVLQRVEASRHPTLALVHGDAIDVDRAARRPQLAADQLEQRRLAAAAGAEDADHLAARHVERQAAQHPVLAVGEVQVADLDEVAGGGCHAR